jgi:hypothetical protein
MVAEVYAGLAAFKSAFDLAKGLKDINDAAIRNAAIIELQGKILAAQHDQSELVQHLRELEQEIASLRLGGGEEAVRVNGATAGCIRAHAKIRDG